MVQPEVPDLRPYVPRMSKKFSHYGQKKDAFREALAAVVGKEPPEYVRGHGLKGMTDKQVGELQDWCSVNARPEWATGLSMIEAAEMIVEEAVGNANILEPESEPE